MTMTFANNNLNFTEYREIGPRFTESYYKSIVMHLNNCNRRYGMWALTVNVFSCRCLVKQIRRQWVEMIFPSCARNKLCVSQMHDGTCTGEVRVTCTWKAPLGLRVYTYKVHGIRPGVITILYRRGRRIGIRETTTSSTGDHDSTFPRLRLRRSSGLCYH